MRYHEQHQERHHQHHQQQRPCQKQRQPQQHQQHNQVKTTHQLTNNSSFCKIQKIFYMDKDKFFMQAIHANFPRNTSTCTRWAKKTHPKLFTPCFNIGVYKLKESSNC